MRKKMITKMTTGGGALGRKRGRTTHRERNMISTWWVLLAALKTTKAHTLWLSEAQITQVSREL
jgi:hypothetical protein